MLTRHVRQPLGSTLHSSVRSKRFSYLWEKIAIFSDCYFRTIFFVFRFSELFIWETNNSLFLLFRTHKATKTSTNIRDCIAECVYLLRTDDCIIISHRHKTVISVLKICILCITISLSWLFNDIGSRSSDHYFRSVCLSVCLFVCLCRVFSAVFDPIWIKLGHMLHVRV